jgi:PIN domain nuclease of toxin-antitoxin system
LILDTTYLLPLAGVAVDTDLLAAIAREEVDLRFRDIAVSLVSVFELQANAAKLNVPAESTIKAVQAISAAFRVEPFRKPEIIEASYELRKIIPDYVDCVIVATAIGLKDDLATEDSLILASAEAINRKHGIHVLRFRDIIKERRK